jgi:hypothetical protein
MTNKTGEHQEKKVAHPVQTQQPCDSHSRPSISSNTVWKPTHNNGPTRTEQLDAHSYLCAPKCCLSFAEMPVGCSGSAIAMSLTYLKISGTLGVLEPSCQEQVPH